MQKIVDFVAARHNVQFNTPQHQTAISNALKMIELLGDKMTVQQLQGILNPLIEAQDTQTIDMLRSICMSRCPVACGSDLRPGADFGDSIEADSNKVKAFGGYLVGSFVNDMDGALALHFAEEKLKGLYPDMSLS